ncbi:hypothetical protein LguiB_017144 [Lonicera macranthoides]
MCLSTWSVTCPDLLVATWRVLLELRQLLLELRQLLACRNKVLRALLMILKASVVVAKICKEEWKRNRREYEGLLIPSIPSYCFLPILGGLGHVVHHYCVNRNLENLFASSECSYGISYGIYLVSLMPRVMKSFFLPKYVREAYIEEICKFTKLMKSGGIYFGYSISILRMDPLERNTSYGPRRSTAITIALLSTPTLLPLPCKLPAPKEVLLEKTEKDYYLPPVLEDFPLSETCTNLIDTSFIVTYGDSQQKYGPLMSLQLGFVPTLVVFSVKMATEVMKIHDLIFCNGSSLRGLQKLSYKGLHIVVLPYNDSWRDRVEKDRHSSSI